MKPKKLIIFTFGLAILTMFLIVNTAWGQSSSSVLDSMNIGVRFGMNLPFFDFENAQDSQLPTDNSYEVEGRYSFSSHLYYEYLILDYLAALLEIGYMQNKWTSNTVTLKDTNLINEPYNMYVDPFDLAEKYGGKGLLSRDMFTVSILAKGSYPFSVGDPFSFGNEMKIIPYLIIGIEFDIITSGKYDVSHYQVIDYTEFDSPFILNMPISLGVEWDMGYGYGAILFDFRVLVQLMKNEEQRIESNADVEYPVDITIPAFSQYLMQLSFGYSFNFGSFN